MSARQDAVALITAVHNADRRSVEMVLDESDLRDLAELLAVIVCAVADHAHRDHGCPHDVVERLRIAGLHWANAESADA
jgi:hypothetical protein